MSSDLRDRQLQRLCDVLEAVDPAASTLCAGWDAHDLAVHVWILKRDPLGWPGAVLPALDLGRSARVRRRWPYAELVRRLRAEPGRIACMPLDRWEGHRHALGEYYVHTQDVARRHGIGQPAPDEALLAALWLRVQVAARALHRRRTPGLVLARPGGGGGGERALVTRGPARVVVTGEPTELMCWAHGREQVADVTVTTVGESGT
ncbi:MAG: maleylpyruvate isomerase family mycothiol-dependent enzyme [Nocardioides sp.]